ncbi:hemolysin family protein [Methylocaldum sp.]|uniref:hemolysin family protein n=1 Tax=Methylocaldum sp. TaxID=1969727 RepID=UPI002D74F8E1|nr:hemolysin family protein [Methylocaldum sp.]HYE35138.1 hemolysin family protein [Methylocaldum sp.]
MEILILVFLFLLNGVFAMSEMAIVSARKIRLQQSAQEGHCGAKDALRLANEPSHFLSTIQVGITLIGILSGAFGEAAISGQLAAYLEQFPEIAPYSRGLSLAVVVIGITYFSLIIGELVPKRLALHKPEKIAMIIARPMRFISLSAYPLVKILSLSTDLILRLFGARQPQEPLITEKEIRFMIDQGTEAGVFHKSEQEMVSNILRLDDLRVGAIMTPRMDIYYLDIKESFEENRRKIIDSPYSRIPVCKDGLDNVIGFVQAKDLLTKALRGENMDLARLIKTPRYVPKSLNPMQLLEEFKRSKTPMALVVDEYGEVAGLVTLKDVMEAIVGDIPMTEWEEEPEAVQRNDGSWLLDGTLSTTKFKQIFDVDELPDEATGNFHTIGGFVMLQLGHVPRATDHFEWNHLRFEVVDMDKNRVDKLLVSPTDLG